ncbi:hypothetical protein KEM52_006321 [Ascosphaera acerosa]|nr:hypothetical protein KEM52_006321 [Ascosphaera acerosa]
MKSSASVVSALAFASVASATIPGCLLAAVNQQPDPSNFKSICGPKAGEVQSTISSLCGDLAKTALNDFKDSCKAQGFPVGATVSVSSSKTQTHSSTATTAAADSTSTSLSSSSPSSAAATTTAPTTTGDSHAVSSTDASGAAAAAATSTETETATATADCTNSIPAKWGADNTASASSPSSAPATNVPVAPGAAKHTGFATYTQTQTRPAGALATGTGTGSGVAPIGSGVAAPSGTASGSGSGSGSGSLNTAPHHESSANGGSQGTAVASHVPAGPTAAAGPQDHAQDVPTANGASSMHKVSAALALVAGVAAFLL